MGRGQNYPATRKFLAMQIAVATNDSGTKVGGHAGQSRHWLLFDAAEGAKPVRLGPLLLDPKMVFHHYKDEQGPHPLAGAGVLIFQTAGEGFLKRMAKKGVVTAMTSESNPDRAAADYVAGCLKPPRPPGLMSWVCKVRDLFSEHK
jgi:hypothetical protein